jgi:hypothetical protein
MKQLEILMETYRISYNNLKGVPFHCNEMAEDMLSARAQFAAKYAHIKVFEAERIYSHKTVQEELRFTLTPDAVAFLLALLNSESRFYIEGNHKVSKEIEDKYFELTGEVLVPKKGLYNIAPDNKWGTEGTLYFAPSIPFPDDFGLELKKPGQINCTKLVWTLVRMGFRLNGQHKKEDILKALSIDLVLA